MTQSKNNKKTSKRTLRVLIAFVAVAAIAAIAAAYLLLGIRYDGAQPVRIHIPAAASDAAVADTLAAKLGGFGSHVARMWRLQGGTAEKAHGSYLISPGARAFDTSRRILHGRQTPVRLTFNNIRTFDQLAQRISSRMEFTAADFTAACDTILPALGFRRQGYPAAFIPDTYEFYWTASPQKVARRLVDERNKFWTDQRRAQAARLGLTPVETATIASIVEEETAKADERPVVARLYLNRLDRKMPLQADPTVKFAVGDFALRRITAAHLRTPSPYNTYLNPGLPPGPIRIPERATLVAVLSAPAHPYIYMCAKDDFSGRHDFTTDYATHLANARRYQSALTRLHIH